MKCGTDTRIKTINGMELRMLLYQYKYLNPRLFYPYVSLEGSFVTYDNKTYVGRGLVIDCV